MSFVHLHNHSEYSLLDGLSRLDDMAARAAELGMPAVALTDHGNVHGAVDFYKACKKAGVKPIIGVEGYVANGSRHTKDPNERFPYHITMLAQSPAGYRNLLNLVTVGHLEGFYYRPRVDRETLEKHSEGIIVLSGCPSAELSRRVQEGREDAAQEVAGWYREVFKDRYYIELMSHDGVPGLQEANRGLVDLARRCKVPMVVTNDLHYVRREDAPLQDILTCIQTNTNVNDSKRLKMEDDSYYLKSAQEMAALWPEIPEALKNTLSIAEQCSGGPEFGKTHLPHYPCPDGMTSMLFLRKLCEEGARRRFPGGMSKQYADRLAYELDVVEKTNFADYFLVVWDIFKFVNQRGILSAVRGSAAASLVLYCLDVTQIDPLAYRLVFERFLNLERKEMPDIDMDFQDDRREEVIRYCVERYGREHVAQIITFGTLGAKAAVRDVTRALGYETALGDRLARAIPFRLNMTLGAAWQESADLQREVTADDRAKQVFETAKRLEGAIRHASTHAAGVVISEQPLTNYTALQRSTSGSEDAPPTTQYAMGPVADVGLLKMDFLGLTNLTILDRVVKLIEAQRGEKVLLGEIPTDAAVPMAAAAYELLSNADTFGVFQLESSGMRRYIRDLKPNSVGDVAAMIALYRPGPMEHITTFIDSKFGRRAVTYPHPALKDILDETYGIIVYQDQVLLIAREFGGYTLGEADILRKAMGKKVPEIMRAQREKFESGAMAKGYSQDLATTMFNLIEPFAGYAFNKAHSVSYAMIAYWTAFFKANYPVEYWTAVLNAFLGNLEKTAESVAEARRQHLPILRPDINSSRIEFAIETTPDGQRAIRYGLAAVKNVGAAAVEPILAARETGGGFTSLEDFCRRVDFKGMNRRTLESLIKVGALDDFGNRGQLLDAAERIVASGQRQARLRDSGQSSLFDMFGAAVPPPSPQILLADIPEASEHERSLWEKDLLGVEISQSAFTRAMYEQPGNVLVFAASLNPERANEKVSAIGQVAAVRELATRKGERFLSVGLAMLDNQVEIVVWPNVLERTSGLWHEGAFVALEGQVRERDGRLSIAVDDAREYVLPVAGDGAAPATASTVVTPPPSEGEGTLFPAGVPDFSDASDSAPDLLSNESNLSNSHSPDWPNRSNTPNDSGLSNLSNPSNKSNSSNPSNSSNKSNKSDPTSDPSFPANPSNRSNSDRSPVNSTSSASPDSSRPMSSITNGQSNNGARALRLRLRETGVTVEDKYRLEDMVKLMLEFRGDSPVMLEIATKGRVVRMELPFVNVDPCQELCEQLAGIPGVEDVAAPGATV